MPRGRKRKIEVPTDTQAQFELADTAENIKRRRMERELRGRGVSKRRGSEKGERERGEKIVRKGLIRELGRTPTLR